MRDEQLRMLVEARTANQRSITELAAARNQAGGDDENQTDPAYRQMLQERDGVKLRIAGLQRAETAARGQIAHYQRRVEAAPLVEQDVAPLERAHELAKARYTELSSKHQNALLVEDLARKQGGERFSILYGAGGPTRIKPDLLRLMLMTIALGLALGGGLVFAAEFLDRSVHDAKALQTEFEIPVLGEIPRIPGV